jgi:hypothetical protein
MPSQINNEGNVHNITANYLKTKPSTRFSTRQLAFVEIEVTGCHTNYANPDSLYSRAVRGVQAVAEVYAVGTPAANKFMVVIAQDTDGADNNDDLDIGSDNDQSMANAVRDSVEGNGDLEVTVNANYKRLSGDGFAAGVATYSDESVAGNNFAA